MVEFGIVRAIDRDTVQLRVKLPARDGMLSPWLPLIVARAGNDQEIWMPEIDEQVACLFDGDLESGVVLGSVFSKTTPPPSTGRAHVQRYRDGTVVKYDLETRRLEISCAGSISIHAGETLDLSAVGALTVRGHPVHWNP